MCEQSFFIFPQHAQCYSRQLESVNWCRKLDIMHVKVVCHVKFALLFELLSHAHIALHNLQYLQYEGWHKKGYVCVCVLCYVYILCVCHLNFNSFVFYILTGSEISEGIIHYHHQRLSEAFSDGNRFT